MKVIDPGHVYEVDILDGVAHPAFQQAITFVKREGAGYPGNIGHHPGTNIQELLRVCIDRLLYLNRQIESVHTAKAAMSIRMALRELEMRAAERHGREWVDPPVPIEQAITCRFCGHVGCADSCNLGSRFYGCKLCRGERLICSATQRPWSQCDCGECERGPAKQTMVGCPECKR